MGFADITSADAVLEAIAECDRLGERDFLLRYGFGPSRHVRLFHGEQDYPAKAIVGVAHGYQFPDAGPLRPSDFTSGESTIAKLRQLGFVARSTKQTPSPSARLYVVRGGRDEEVVDYALQSSVVAIGWSELGDLSALDASGLSAAVDSTYDDVEPAKRGQWKAALRAFKEIQVGDWVILPVTSRGQFAVGVICGDYEHRPDNDPLATHCYPVEWLETALPRALLGDLRSRVDLPPTAQRIGVDDAVALVQAMIETGEPIRLGGTTELTEIFEAALAAVLANDLDGVRRRIDDEAPEALRRLVPGPHPIGSGTGQSTPADVPWVSIYPEDATASAKQGIYAVYLFAADGSAVYLSFMQGTENVSGGLRPLRKRAIDMRRAAGLDNAGDAVALASQSTRPRKYQAASAYAIRYARGAVPSDAALLEDLATVLGHVDAALDAGLELDPTREPLHLVLKWSAEIEPDSTLR